MWKKRLKWYRYCLQITQNVITTKWILYINLIFIRNIKEKLHLITLDEFIARKGTICLPSNKYKLYHHLGLAEFACEQDKDCVGIVNNYCDREGPFELCKGGFVAPDSYQLHCIYQKKRYSGKLFVTHLHGSY